LDRWLALLVMHGARSLVAIHASLADVIRYGYDPYDAGSVLIPDRATDLAPNRFRPIYENLSTGFCY
jgi:hypothetical protein